MLLAVPMEALCASPAATINLQDTRNLPIRAITYQYLLSFSIFSFAPEYDNPNAMVHIRDANAFGKVILPRAVEHNRLAILRGNLKGQFFGLELFAAEDDLTIEFQIPNICSAIGIDMVEVCRAREPTVEGKGAWDIVSNNPIYQLPKKLVVVHERNLLLLALFFLNETVEFQRIVFPGCAYIIGDNVVVGYLVALFGVVPEIADIFYAFAGMIHQDIVNSNNPLFAVAGIGTFLQPFEPFEVKFFLVPLTLCDPAIKTGLIGRDSKLSVDCRDVFVIRNHQTGQIFGKMSAFWLVGKMQAEFLESLFDDCRGIPR